jgi:hypothetical protein
MEEDLKEGSAARPGRTSARIPGCGQVESLATVPESETRPQATFDAAIDALRSTGASVGMRKLVEIIVRHGREEGALLARYEELSTEATDESVRYLVNLILEDEHRHHQLLAELSTAMAWGLASEPPTSAIPGLPTAINGDLLEQTKLVRKSEQADFRALRRIRRRLRPFAKTTLWVLVLDLMLLDTKKHATILRFLERRPKNQ